MNTHIVLGLFALYVASVSLLLVLTGRQDALLALVRRFWGRTVGHSVYFMVHVALPVIVCVLCLGWGVRNYVTPDLASYNAPSQQFRINLDVKEFPRFDIFEPSSSPWHQEAFITAA